MRKPQPNSEQRLPTDKFQFGNQDTTFVDLRQVLLS